MGPGLPGHAPCSRPRRGPTPFMTHFLVTKVLCASFSGPDWLVRRTLTVTEFKLNPWLRTPGSGSWVLVPPPWKGGKSVTYDIWWGSPRLAVSVSFPSRSTVRCLPRSPVSRAARGPRPRPPRSPDPRLQLGLRGASSWERPWVVSESLPLVLGIWARGSVRKRAARPAPGRKGFLSLWLFYCF